MNEKLNELKAKVYDLLRQREMINAEFERTNQQVHQLEQELNKKED